MSPVIRISDQLYEGLKKYSSFEDTPASVIEKLLKHYVLTGPEKPKIESVEPKAEPDEKEINLDPDRPYDLLMSKIMAAKIGARQARNWNELVRMAHIAAFDYIGDIDELIRKSLSNIVKKDMHDEKGFTYVPEIRCSIQGVDANTAWKHSLHLAKTCKMNIAVAFMWRDNEKAVFPGKVGVIKWPRNT